MKGFHKKPSRNENMRSTQLLREFAVGILLKGSYLVSPEAYIWPEARRCSRKSFRYVLKELWLKILESIFTGNHI